MSFSAARGFIKFMLCGLLAVLTSSCDSQISDFINQAGRGDDSTSAPSASVPVVAPSGLSYGVTPQVLYTNEALTPIAPTVSGGAAQYSVSPSLPSGLSLNTSTGAITGMATSPQGVTTYTVTASNSAGSVDANIVISIGGGFTVDAFTDTHDAVVGNGICRDASNQCSLRAAVEEANSIGTTYSVGSKIGVASAGTVTLSLGEIAVTTALIINGNSLIVSGGNASRVFNLTGTPITFSNFTIRDALVAANGGGILHNKTTGTLTLTDMIIRNNTLNTGCCTDYNGAGLNSNGLVVTISNSKFISNAAHSAGSSSGNGGAIAFTGARLDISKTEFTSNETGRRGGGIYASGGTGVKTITVFGSHFQANDGGTHAGAVENFGTHLFNIEGCSFRANTGSTGSIVNGGGLMTIKNSTIIPSNNQNAISNSLGHGVQIQDSTFLGTPNAGGVVNNGSSSASDMTLTRTMVLSTNGSPACTGGFGLTSNGFNLSSDASCSLSQGTDLPNQPIGNVLVSATPVLYGLTYILPLKTGSPAIDAAGTTCDSMDQRELTRPVDKGGGLKCDIGAYEEQ